MLFFYYYFIKWEKGIKSRKYKKKNQSDEISIHESKHAQREEIGREAAD